MKRPKLIAGSEKKFFDFISNLNKKDKVAILSHNDLDGISSAVIVSKAIGKVDFLRFISYGGETLEETFLKLKEKKINKIIILDFAFDHEYKRIKNLETFSHILILDHHLLEEDINSEKIIMIKSESSYPASYLCYYFFSKIKQISSWIAALGILGDNPQKYNEKNAIKVFNDFGIKDKIDLGGYLPLISAACLYFEKEKVIELYNLFMNLKNISELKQVEKYAQPIRKEINKQIVNFYKERETYGDLYFFQFKTKRKLNPLLMSELSLEEKDKTFLVVQEVIGSETVGISARRLDRKINCSELLKKATVGISNSTAGGHFAASGASFKREYLSKFKKNLLKEYNLISTIR